MEQVEYAKRREKIALERIDPNTIKRSRLRGSKARILVVDDESPVVETLREVLMTAGFEVETAESGKQALGLLMSSQHFDLMITDMRMPGMDGLELLREVHHWRGNLPVIVLTGYASFENGVDSLEAGACDYVIKPFNSKDLILTVKGALKEKS